MSVAITDREFARFRSLIYELAGIHLSDAKKALVTGRLGRRLRHHGLHSYSDYYRLVAEDDAGRERQLLVDLLTTNETYFFREPRHFELLRERLLPSIAQEEVRVWSAASSSGQEPYTLAMVLDDYCGARPWSVLGTDISSRVLERARGGVYPNAEARHIPGHYLRRYCLKGVRTQEGNFAVHERLRRRVEFRQLNLNGSWSRLQRFDVIFLRNVMIYFDRDTKQRLVERLHDQLRPGGYLVIGHSETLNGVSGRFHTIVPSVYQRR